MVKEAILLLKRVKRMFAIQESLTWAEGDLGPGQAGADRVLLVQVLSEEVTLGEGAGAQWHRGNSPWRLHLTHGRI